MEFGNELVFQPNLHKSYLLRFLKHLLPHEELDPTRIVLGYFIISGLEVLNELDSLSEENKKSIIDWIYSLQVQNDKELVSGFQGSSCANTSENKNKNGPCKWGHIANTYAALCTLLILGDDLSRVHKKSIIKSLKILQLPDGSFKGAKCGTENDMRFVFCAVAVSYILNDWSGIDFERMIDFIQNSISYDGGIGQGPGLESHSGSTFCAIASLALSNKLHILTEAQLTALQRWLLNRFNSGFNGRTNKPADTCYSFWTGGALKIINSYQFIENKGNNKFIFETQDRYGGFSKSVDSIPDPMHTYFGLAGLSLMGEKSLNPMFCDLNLSQRAHNHLKRLQETWDNS